MEMLLALFALTAGLLLVAAAFAYLVDARQGQRVLQHLRTLLIVLIVIFASLMLINAIDDRALFGGLVALSVVAYVIRESRKPRSRARQSLGGAERTPMLPTTQDDDEKEGAEQ